MGMHRPALSVCPDRAPDPKDVGLPLGTISAEVSPSAILTTLPSWKVQAVDGEMASSRRRGR